MTYERAVALLENRQETRIRLGLARIRRHLRSLGDPQEQFDSIHVAGTNGKGSVCAMLAAALQSAGFRTGLYVSPHLRDARERISINGRPIGRRSFARLMRKSIRHESKDPLTYFELLTSIAFQRFREKRVQIAVLETGLGGRFDATNVLKRPAAALITSIDYDHMQFLGKTLAAIAREKAGIIKNRCLVLCAETKPEPLKAIRRQARRQRADLRIIRPGACNEQGALPLSQRLAHKSARYRAATASSLPAGAARLPSRVHVRPARVDWSRAAQFLGEPSGGSIRLNLLGGAQPQNAALALETLKAIEPLGYRVSPFAARRGLAAVRWPGRFQVLRRGSRVLILDGAHNAAAMRNFVSTLESSPWAKVPKTFIIGMLADKEHRKMVRILSPQMNHRVIVTEPPSPRALAASRLARETAESAPKAEITVAADASEAMRIWRHVERGRAPCSWPRVACVCGSFYLVGAILEYLSKRKF